MKNRREMVDLHIDKDLESEAMFAGDIAYFPLAGRSEMVNFRSPDSYVFIFFEKCRGYHAVDFTEYQQRDCQVHISFPGQIHSWKTEAGTKGHKLIVSKRFIEMHPCGQRFSALRINNFPIIDLSSDFGKILTLEFDLIKRDMDTVSGKLDTACLRAQLILSMISNQIDQLDQDEIKSAKKTLILSRFAELIEANFDKSKSVLFYADKLAVTANYLNIVSKRHLNLTAKEIIDTRIVLEAKRLLLGSALSIKQICYCLGFSSGTSFATFMLKNTGFYPKMFRKGLASDRD